MTDVNVMVLTGYGIGCDYETAYAFDMAGAISSRVHINSLVRGDVSLDKFHILAFTDGFSWGHDHGAGVVQAVHMKNHLNEAIEKFVRDGKLIIGISNGFQTLVNMGFLPGFDNNYRSKKAALIQNDCGNFRDDWVTLKADESSPCVFTKGLDIVDFPVRHGEGKFYAEPDVLKRLAEQNQIALKYAFNDGAPAKGKFPENPDGSVDDIAGICDESGRVFGLMPHPEGFIFPVNHPDWVIEKEKAKRKGGEEFGTAETPGIRLFKNGVEYVRNNIL